MSSGLRRIGTLIQSLRQRLGAIPLRWIVRTVVALGAVSLLIVLAGSVLTIVAVNAGWRTLPREPVDAVVYPDQGWGAGIEAAGRQTYYFTPQGAGLKDMRYSWFVNLEMPLSRRPFTDPDLLRAFGFLVDAPTGKNPDGLPVGFTRHFDRDLNQELLDVTCAACHTGQINVTRDGRTTAIRIDGGQALHAFTDADPGNFIPTMIASMTSTAANPFKFRRFARQVLGDRASSFSGSWALHRDLRGVIWTFVKIAWNEKWHGLYPTQEGNGRTDALTRIANTVFAENLDAINYVKGDGPVSYPPLWNIWKFDWVQYNASVSQPMARNMGEAMGVGAKYALVDRYGKALPPDQRFRSTARVEDLHTIERTLRRLRPPAWDESLLGPIDRTKAERGKQLFNENCAGCHGPHIALPEIKARNAPLKTDADPEWLVKTVCVDDIGTDPNTALNFKNATVNLTRTGLTAADLRVMARRSYQAYNERQAAYLNGAIARLKTAASQQTPIASPQTAYAGTQLAYLQSQLATLETGLEQRLARIDPTKVPVGEALTYLGTLIRRNAYRDMRYTSEEQADHDGFGTLDVPRAMAAYKPRPLAGMWATPPYLHNGSVPTIYDLLSPVEERPKVFFVGSREFDPVRVGLAASDEGFQFDTSEPGNSNRGHEFNKEYVEWTENSPPQNGLIGPLLTPDDRLAIIEHLKVRNDDLDGPKELRDIEWTECPRPIPPATVTQRSAETPDARR